MKKYLGQDKQKPGSSVVYWVRRPEYTDIFTQGYVGISSQSVMDRWTDHRRGTNGHNGILKSALSGNKDTVFEVVLVADSREYCEYIEGLLRPSERIGWNLAVGGGKLNNKLGGQTNRLRHIRIKLANANKACELWWEAERKMLKRQSIEARKDYVPYTRTRKLDKRNTSGFTGVTWFKNYGMWRSQIMDQGKLKCLGYFRDINKAAEAYRTAKAQVVERKRAARGRAPI